MQALEDGKQVQVLEEDKQVQALEDGVQVPALEDGEQVQQLEGAPCLAVELALPVCGHRGLEEGICWGRDDVFSLFISANKTYNFPCTTKNIN